MTEHLCELGLFTELWALCGRVCPEPLGVEWWVSTCEVVDVASVRLHGVWVPLQMVQYVPMSTVVAGAWWGPLCVESIRMAKVNASGRLSGRETLAFIPIKGALAVLAFAARDESQHTVLLGSGITDALEYACVHDFITLTMSVAATAASALVRAERSGAP